MRLRVLKLLLVLTASVAAASPGQIMVSGKAGPGSITAEQLRHNQLMAVLRNINLREMQSMFLAQGSTRPQPEPASPKVGLRAASAEKLRITLRPPQVAPMGMT